MTKVTPEQAKKEFHEWLIIRDKPYCEESLWEFFAELLEVNHQFYNKLSFLEDSFDEWAKALVSYLYKRS